MFWSYGPATQPRSTTEPARTPPCPSIPNASAARSSPSRAATISATASSTRSRSGPGFRTSTTATAQPDRDPELRDLGQLRVPRPRGRGRRRRPPRCPARRPGARVLRAPLAPAGSLRSTGSIVAVYDKGAGRGALVDVEMQTEDADGRPLFRGVTTLYCRGGGGLGDRGGRPARPSRPSRPAPRSCASGPARPPRRRCCTACSAAPTHSTSTRPSPWASASRPDRARPVHLRLRDPGPDRPLWRARPQPPAQHRSPFARPLLPGRAIETQMWTDDSHEMGEVGFRVIEVETRAPILTHGRARFGALTPDNERNTDHARRHDHRWWTRRVGARQLSVASRDLQHTSSSPPFTRARMSASRWSPRPRGSFRTSGSCRPWSARASCANTAPRGTRSSATPSSAI